MGAQLSLVYDSNYNALSLLVPILFCKLIFMSFWDRDVIMVWIVNNKFILLTLVLEKDLIGTRCATNMMIELHLYIKKY